MSHPGSIAVLAVASFRESFRQPVTWTLLLVFGVLVALLPGYTFFAFGAEGKLMLDAGLASIRLVGLLLALFLGSGLFAMGAGNRPLHSLLARPISRSAVVTGQVIGLVGAIAAVQAGLAIVLAGTLRWAEGEALHAVWLGTYLAFLQGAVMTSFAVALSTAASLMVTVVGCVVLFALGHLAPAVGDWAGRVGGELAAWIVRAVVPDFAAFDATSALSASPAASGEYLVWATASALAYGSVALGVAVLVFHRRDVN